MSTLKHNIRHQQAQLNNLETMLRAGPRPLPPPSPPRSPDLSEFPSPQSPPTAPTATKMQRRSSFDVLQILAGPDSNLPLPLPYRDGRGSPLKSDGSIPEGIPVDFGAGTTSPSSYKRMSSPTRTLSRMSVSQLCSFLTVVSRLVSLILVIQEYPLPQSVCYLMLFFAAQYHNDDDDRKCPRSYGRRSTRRSSSIEITRFRQLC